jgi:hypothetical protein
MELTPVLWLAPIAIAPSALATALAPSAVAPAPVPMLFAPSSCRKITACVCIRAAAQRRRYWRRGSTIAVGHRLIDETEKWAKVIRAPNIKAE